MFTPTLRCECAQPASDRLMRKWCIGKIYNVSYCRWGLNFIIIKKKKNNLPLLVSSYNGIGGIGMLLYSAPAEPAPVI